MSKYLITGGAGFIGSNFCIYLVNKNKDDIIYCLDALTYAGNLENLASIFNKDNFKFIHGDICNDNLINDLFSKENFDYVINFAAESHVDRSITDPYIFIKTNVVGVQVLLNASLKYNIKRFHQLSTDEVYGSLPLDTDKYFKEEDILNPSSPYSASKASADLLCLAYYKTYNLDVTISRCSNNLGPYQFKEKLIPLMIDKALNNEKLPIYGNGLNIRDWIFVTDHISAIDIILHKGRSGNIYNVGANNNYSNIDICKYILKYLNKNEDLISFVEDRKGHDLRYSIDSSKLMKELNWKPLVNFKDSLDKTISWYLNNQEWLNNDK